MKQCVFILAALAITANAAAQMQQNESITIDRTTAGTTSIEINKDGVFVNGQQVATRSELNSTNLSKKITINEGSMAVQGTTTATVSDTRTGNAILGVVTNAQHDRAGAYVVDVTRSSAADNAGLRRGDLIIRVDSIYIANGNDLINTIRKYPAGTNVNIRYRRAEKEFNTTARLDAAPFSTVARVFELGPADHLNPSFGPGLRQILRDINPFDSGPRLGISVEEMAEQGGVRITRITPNMAAAQSGLLENDVIVRVEETPIQTMDNLERYLANLKAGTKLKMEVIRDGNRITKMVTIPKEKVTRDF